MSERDFDLNRYPPLIPAPSTPADWDAWRSELRAWRDGVRKTLDLSTYDQPELAWMRSCYVCGKVMLFDREFYDEQTNRFRVGPYLARMRRDFGGLDALMLWQAYPRIGIDSRNQFDHYRLAPGLKDAIDELHTAGVRVLLAYNPWDVGTRREERDDVASLAAMVREFRFDGIFLDTLHEGAAGLRNALGEAHRGLVLEPEAALPVAGIPTHHASWGQWFKDSEAPGVLRNRWVEPRHMMHLIHRWHVHHSDDLQTAWMNGAGIFVWENIFGSWNPWTDRDKAILRSMSAVRRRYTDLFSSGECELLTPCQLPAVFANRWSHGGLQLWTLINRAYTPISGVAFPVTTTTQTRLFDLLRGVELTEACVEIPPRSIAGLLALPTAAVDAGFMEFLRAQAAEHHHFAAAAPVRVESLATRVLPPHAPGTGTATISAGTRTIRSRFNARECGEYGGAPFPNFIYPWLHFERIIAALIELGAVMVEPQEVTNEQFKRFLDATGYAPPQPESFLAHWDRGHPRAGEEHAPVVFIDLNDARAYCRWAGKRLPTEHEWQVSVAEQGSPHGVVWNWTESEHFDGHTRFSILKGGCAWRAEGSPWYADSGARAADWSTKLIHFYPALDRCETIGFRCAVDLS